MLSKELQLFIQDKGRYEWPPNALVLDFSGNSLIPIARDSPFLPNIPFLTLSYLLISNHLWVYAACQLEVNNYGRHTHTHTHTHTYIPLPILFPLPSSKESFKYQFKISKHFMINWRFICAKSNYSRKSEKRGVTLKIKFSIN